MVESIPLSKERHSENVVGGSLCNNSPASEGGEGRERGRGGTCEERGKGGGEMYRERGRKEGEGEGEGDLRHSI